MVDELYYNDNEYSCIDHEEFSQQGFNQFSNVSKIQKVSSIQKQPYVSLPKWNTNHLQGEGKIVLISFVSVVQNTNIIPKYNWLTACHYFGLTLWFPGLVFVAVSATNTVLLVVFTSNLFFNKMRFLIY